MDRERSKKQAKNRFIANILKTECDIVWGTLEGSGDTIAKTGEKVQYALIDECGQAHEPNAVITISSVDPKGHVVLVGDHQQLPPTVFSKEAEWENLNMSLLHRLHGTPGTCFVMLSVQYRMLLSICAWPSQAIIMRLHNNVYNDQ